MKKMTGQQVRETWLKFFQSKGHHVEKGASLIPYNDPTLLWINSGVAAIKKFMDGREVPPSRRITNVQKSIRTNDIENVGLTDRHHTFFEMLGNFSIGDYFRNEVIPWAFEILTSKDYFDMPKDKLYFTYNPIDQESYKLWKKQGVEESHLIPLESNYWEIGEGPAGPTTEVFFDRGDKSDPEHLGVKLLQDEIETDRYIEIWGIVFSQYNAVPGTPREQYKELPSKNIDTGAGLERITSVLQQTPSNFETDLFMPIINKVEEISHTKYTLENKIPFRVIADHARAVTFALSDGAMFSNEGRGYVLRRLIRRAMRFGKQIGINEPFIYRLVDVVININKDFYPELVNNQKMIEKNVKIEEEKFIKTLSTGEQLLLNLIKDNNTLSGKDAFKLYDTYGFPLDLTKDICKEHNVTVDECGFNQEMEQQKERARNARSDEQSMHKQSEDLLNFVEPSTFNYDGKNINSKVIGLFKDGVKVDEIVDEGEVIFETTNFYAESGGEVSDTGIIYNDNCKAIVKEVQKAPNKQHMHYVHVEKGVIKLNDEFNLELDHKKREFIKRNHSVTHLLQSALIEVLGDHIKQMGSFNNEQYMRFDFTHNEKINQNQIKQIEEIVNNYIASAIPSNIRVLPIEEANKLNAKAFFSDKYGDQVRVVSFGDVSTEFCGGCHVDNTSEIGLFVIEAEESIASGVRRIQGRTSIGAYHLLKERESLLDNVKNQVGAKSYIEINDRIKTILNEKEEYKNKLDAALDKMSNSEAKALSNEFKQINGINVLAKYISGANQGLLMKMADSLKIIHQDYVILLAGGSNGDIPLTCLVGGNGLKTYSAGNIIKEIAPKLGGNGGGRPNMANGKGKDLSKIDEVFTNFVNSLVK